MPFRPNQHTTVPAVPAPHYAPSSAQGSSSHHQHPGPAPLPADSHAHPDSHHPHVDGPDQSIVLEAHAAAATLVSLHQPMHAALDILHSQPLSGQLTDEADGSYTEEEESASDGDLDQSMTDMDGGVGAGATNPWGPLSQTVGMSPASLAELQSSGILFQVLEPMLGQQNPEMASFPGPMGPHSQYLWATALMNNAGTAVNAALMALDGPGLPEANDDEFAANPPQPPPAPQSNPSFGPLGPDNPGVLDFLTYWARLGNFSPNPRSSASRVPSVLQVTKEVAKKRAVVRFDDLRGDETDAQGLDWMRMGITRKAARERRRLIYRNYVNAPGSDKWRPSLPDVAIPNTESYFRFSRMDIRQNVHLAHFQLRNLLGCAGQSHAFYPGKKFVHHLNPLTGQSEAAMDLSDIINVQISTLDADNDVVVAGTFTGEYCMRSVYATDESYRYSQGQITNNSSGITNHLQIHKAHTSGSPRVAFSSNDQGFRVMDVATEKFILETYYPFPMNCSAISADRRLRVMVGDSYEALIVNAESGEVVQRLFGHRDYGFACDWSDDGWTVATAAQDRGIKIWDARRWTDSSGLSTPLTTIRSEMAGVRGLRFSPAGSGPRVLVAAEEADFVNIIDAQTFRRKQTFDIFGEIGGVAFSNEGRTLNVLCCDRSRGGLVQLDRHDYGPKYSFDEGSGYSIAGIEQPFEATLRSAGQGRAGGGTYPRRSHALPPKRRRLYLDDLQPF